jgi:hypothetical protein
VAYGSGIEYMNRGDDPACHLVDDSTAIAQILREGMPHCRRRLPAQHFLRNLGVRGHAYSDMVVTSVPPHLRPALPSRALGAPGLEAFCNACAAGEDLCKTLPPESQSRTSTRTQSPTPALHVQRNEASKLGLPLHGRCTPPMPMLSTPSWTPRGHSLTRLDTPRQLGRGPARHMARQNAAQAQAQPTQSVVGMQNYSGSAVAPPSPQVDCRNCRLMPGYISPGKATPGYASPSFMPLGRAAPGAGLPGTIEARQHAAPVYCPRLIGGRAGMSLGVQPAAQNQAAWRSSSPIGSAHSWQAAGASQGCRTPPLAWRGLAVA